MKRVLLDVNVVLDVFLDRPPSAAAASALWAAASRKQLELFIAAHGLTTIFYLLARQRGAAFARRIVNELLIVTRVATVDEAVVRRALGLGWRDFEDAVCAAAAEGAGCGLLVTRDPRGYALSPVPVADPHTALSLLHEGPDSGQVGERKRLSYGASRTRARKRARSRRFDSPEGGI